MEPHRQPQRTASFPSSPVLRPMLIVLLFSIFILLFLPSFLSKGIRPAASGLIKNPWDALNFLLVLFAILCGLLSRNTPENNSPRHQQAPSSQVHSFRSTPETEMLSRFSDSGVAHRRMRSSSSDPDMRQDWATVEERRFADDIQIHRHRSDDDNKHETRAWDPVQEWGFADSFRQPEMMNDREAVEKLPESQSNTFSTDLRQNSDEVHISDDHIRKDSTPVVTNTVRNEETVKRKKTEKPMRSSSSYPDLRHGWIPVDEWRFSDDIHLHRKQPEMENPSPPEVKIIPVDTFNKIPAENKSDSTPPPAPPPLPKRQPRRRTTKKMPKSDQSQESTYIPPAVESTYIPPAVESTYIPPAVESTYIPPAPPPPPPRPPTPTRDPKHRHQRKKSGGGAKDFASALAQFYQKKTKKSGRSKTATVTAHDSTSTSSPPSPAASGGGVPPPPPPPPPPSVFNKLFTHKKSGGKSKTVPPPPPPPPLSRTPPPPPQSRTPMPPPPQTRTPISHIESSPLPPTSPHSVRRRRDRSAPSNSILRSSPTPPPPPMSPSSCPPSPDVNNKADMFIRRFRAGLQLEKQNSIKAKGAAPPPEEEEEMVIGTLFDD